MRIDTFLRQISICKDTGLSSRYYGLVDSYKGNPDDIFKVFNSILSSIEIVENPNYCLDDICLFDAKVLDVGAITLEGTQKELLELNALIQSNKKNLCS